MTSDANGNLLVVDGSNLRQVTPTFDVTSPTAAIGYTNFGFARGIAADSQGNTYVSDWGGHRIMKMTSGGVVSVFAGDVNLQPGSADGQGTAARFNTPNGLAVDAADNVYVADVNNDVIRKITPSGNVTTIGGLANQPANAADGIGSAARFYRPVAVAVDTAGKIYVADDGNQRISVGILAQAAFPAITIQPTSQAAGVGSSLTLQVSASGAQPLSYQWVFGSALPGATNTSLSLTNVQLSNAGNYFVVVSKETLI